MIDVTVHFFDLDAVVVDDRLMNPRERDRVSRKATARLRQRQAASFQCVRRLLGETLGLDPGHVPIAVAGNGKPFLEWPSPTGAAEAPAVCRFNVSHSDGVGMLAVGPREIGCDVEHLISRPGDGLAEEILSAAEIASWRALPETLRQTWLTRAWVRKEAALKATGSGLRIPPRTIDVGGGNAEGEAWTLALEGRRWIGHDVFDGVPEGYRAALCIECGGG